MTEPEESKIKRIREFFEQAYPEDAEKMLLQSAVFDQVRRGALSLGKAADLLGVSRWSFVYLWSERSLRERWAIWRFQRGLRIEQRRLERSQAPPSLPESAKLKVQAWRHKKQAAAQQRRDHEATSPTRLKMVRQRLDIWRQLQRERQFQHGVHQAHSPRSRFQDLKQRYHIWRRLRRERRLDWEINNPDKMRLRHRWHGFLFGLFVLSLIVMYGYLVAREMGSDKKPEDMFKVAVTVNGKAVSDESFESTLRQAYGPVVLQKLTEQEVIRQEAARLAIVLTPAESENLGQAIRGDALSAIHLRDLETALLLRKITLHRVGRKRKEDVYRTFKPDLVLYTVGGYRFVNRLAAQRFEAGLAGGMSIDTAAQKFATDGLFPVKLGTYTRSLAKSQLGPAAADAIDGARPGARTRPLTAAGGLVVYRVLGVAEEFEQVESAIDDIIAEADSNLILFNLLSKARIESPHLELSSDTPPRSKSRT